MAAAKSESLYEPDDFLDWTAYAQKYITKRCRELKCHPDQVSDDDVKTALAGRILESPMFTIRNFFVTTTKKQEVRTIEPTVGQILFDIACESQRKSGVAQRVIEIKPRQVGWTTWMIARGMWRGLQPNSNIVFMVSDDDVVKDINKRVATIYNNLGWMAPMRRIENQGRVFFSNPDAKTRDFEKGLESQIIVVSPGPIRGVTPTVLVLSEFAHWEDTSNINPSEVLTGVMSGMSAGPESAVFIDTTPNGYDEDYYPIVMEAIERNPKWVKSWERKEIPTREELICGVYGQPDRPEDGWVPAFMSFLWHPEFTSKDDSPFGQLKKLTPQAKQHLQATLGKEEKYGNEEETELVQRYGASLGRIAWRRYKIDNDIQGYDARQKVLTFRQEYCLAADTRIQTKNGLVRIDEVPIGYICSAGPIVDRFSTGERETVLVTTASGFQIRCTPNHKIFCEDNRWVEAQYTVGENVILERPRFSDGYFSLVRGAFGGSFLSTKIDERWGKFLGYYMSDGCLRDQKMAIACDAKDGDVAEDVAQVVRSLFGDPQIRDHNGSRYINLSRKNFIELFKELGISRINEEGRNVRRICVPDCIWKSPKDVVREFLKSLFEGDGWRSQAGNHVKFFGKGDRFVRDVQLLLFGFGIRSNVRRIKKTASSTGREYFGSELVVNSGQISLFMGEIGFISKRKSERPLSRDKRLGRPPKQYSSQSDLVVSVVADMPCEVWDLTIQGEPQFGANGLLVHNSHHWALGFVDFGNQAFDPAGLDAVRRQARAPSARGMLQATQAGAFLEWEIDQTWISDWEEMRFWAPFEPHERYVIGVDLGVAFDSMDVDQTYACVLRRRDRKQVAIYEARVPMHRVRRAIYSLYRYYGNAYLGVEVDSNKSIVRELFDMGATNQYRYKRLDMDIIDETKWLGWETNHHTRGMMEGAIIEAIARRDEGGKPDPDFILRDQKTITQLCECKRYDDGTIKARAGRHDDAFMALGIAMAVDRDPLHPYVPPRAVQERAVSGTIETYAAIMAGKLGKRNQPRLADM